MPEQQDVEWACISTYNGDSWMLANIGLTSTDVAALAVNGSDYHLFAETYSIMGKGGGMFRSTDNGDTWTEQNGGFTALDVNGVVINPIGYILQAQPAACSGQCMTPTNGITSTADYFRFGGNVWVVATGGFPREDLPMPELAAAVSLEASDPLPRCGSFRDRGFVRRQPRGPCPRWLIRGDVSAQRGDLLNGRYAIRGLAS